MLLEHVKLNHGQCGQATSTCILPSYHIYTSNSQHLYRVIKTSNHVGPFILSKKKRTKKKLFSNIRLSTDKEPETCNTRVKFVR